MSTNERRTVIEALEELLRRGKGLDEPLRAQALKDWTGQVTRWLRKAFGSEGPEVVSFDTAGPRYHAMMSNDERPDWRERKLNARLENLASQIQTLHDEMRFAGMNNTDSEAEEGPTTPVVFLRRQAERGQLLLAETVLTDDDVGNWAALTAHWLEKAFGEDSNQVQSFHNTGGNRIGQSQKKLRAQLGTLRALTQIVEDEYQVDASRANSPVQPETDQTESNPERLASVFVVHGHDNEMRLEVCRFIEQIDMEAIVLSESVNQGRTIIEKLEDEGDRAGYAVVLVSPDDVGGKDRGEGADLEGRPRQNVVFELGLFIGKLGRQRVCLLKRGEVDILSDIHGLVYTSWSSDSDWRVRLAREMKAAGMQGNWAAMIDT